MYAAHIRGDGVAASVVSSLNNTHQTTLVATITAIMLVADDLIEKIY